MPRKSVPSDASDETPDASAAATRPLPRSTRGPAVDPTTQLRVEATADRTDPEVEPSVGATPAESLPAPAAAPVTAVPTAAAPVAPRTSGARLIPFLLGAAAVVLVIVLAGGTSWVVARATAAQPLPVASASPQKEAGGQSMKRAQGGAVVRGTVQSMSGSTWSIETAKQGSVTVAVTDRTRYLDDGAPASTAAFHVGDTVIVAGARSGGTLTATRIVHRTAAPNS